MSNERMAADVTDVNDKMQFYVPKPNVEIET